MSVCYHSWSLLEILKLSSKVIFQFTHFWENCVRHQIALPSPSDLLLSVYAGNESLPFYVLADTEKELKLVSLPQAVHTAEKNHFW